MRSVDRLGEAVLRKVFETFSWILAFFAIIVGVSIIAGGDDRWAGEELHLAMNFPGAPDTWGWMIFGFGSLFTAGLCMDILIDKLKDEFENDIEEYSRIVIGLGSAGCSIWAFALGTTFLAQLIVDSDQVSNLGFPVWYFIGILYLLRAIANLHVLQ